MNYKIEKEKIVDSEKIAEVVVEVVKTPVKVADKLFKWVFGI